MDYRIYFRKEEDIENPSDEDKEKYRREREQEGESGRKGGERPRGNRPEENE